MTTLNDCTLSSAPTESVHLQADSAQRSSNTPGPAVALRVAGAGGSEVLPQDKPNRRLLIVDDTPAIHEDFHKILAAEEVGALELTEAALFGGAIPSTDQEPFQLDSAHQGQEALHLVERASAEGHPYAVAFVDIRMPPGWDGLETIERLWAVDPALQIVVATAYSDYSWNEIVQRFGAKDNLLILKKPFDNVEVLQLAHALTAKWELAQKSRVHLQDLDRLVTQRTHELKQAAVHILKLNRLYSVLSRSNELAVRSRSIKQLCEQACRIAVEDGLFRLAWVGLLDPATQDIKPLAYAGCTTGYLDRIRVSADPTIPEGRGPGGVAFREGRCSICNTVEGRPELAPWRQAFEEFGLSSVGVFPLKVNQVTVGVLAFYSAEPGFFNEEEILLLEQLSADLSFGMEFLEQDQQLRLHDTALESAANSVVITDPQGVILWHNAAFTRLTGYTTAEVRGKKPSLLKSGKHTPGFYAHMWATISGGRAWRGEIVNRRKDGTLYTEEMTITPVTGSQGSITHYVAIKQDVTERKQTELRLAAFSALGLRLSTAQTVKEAARVISEAARQLLGWDTCACDLYSATEDLIAPVLRMRVKGDQTVECPTGEHQPPGPLARRALCEGGGLLRHQHTEADADQSSGVAPGSGSLLFVPIRNGNKTTGVLSIQSRAPDAYNEESLETLQALADHCGGALDRIKAEEALRFTQEQLRQSQKLEAIGQLAGGIAHDFNNLLAVIRGNTDLVLMKSAQFTPEETDCLGQVVAATDRAANLTRQLLAFGRKQVMQTQPLELPKAVGNLTKMLKRIIGEHIQLECQFQPGLPSIRADVSMIEQALINLVVNARDAMPRGGQLVIAVHAVALNAAYVHRSPESRPGCFVTLSVADTGTGIAPENLPRVFEPFFTTKEVGKGTGLGLATVYGIAKQHEGWVEAASELGVGSTFTVYFPALELSADAPGEAAVSGEPLRGSETILLVEDEDTVRRLTRRVLESFGYSVEECASGKQALGLSPTQLGQIDLVLTDVVLPGGTTGRELADELRTRKPDLKVIFTSGYGGEVLGQDTEMIRRTKTYFLPKPCSPKDILLTVRQCLDEQGASNQAKNQTGQCLLC